MSIFSRWKGAQTCGAKRVSTSNKINTNERRLLNPGTQSWTIGLLCLTEQISPRLPESPHTMFERGISVDE